MELVKKPLGPTYPALPTTPTLGSMKTTQLKWLGYGDPGIGKSSFFSKATDGKRSPLFFQLESGLTFLKVNKQPIMTWKQFKYYVKLLTQDNGKEAAKAYSMIVIDTADLLFKLCRQEICKQHGWSHVSDAEWGKGYELVRDEFEQEVIKLAKLDEAEIGLAFISHAKDVEIRGRVVRTSKLVPTLPKQARDIIAPLCDVITYMGFSPEKADKTEDGEFGRIAIFAPSETVEAKDRTGLLPEQCPLDFNVVREALEGNGPRPERAPVRTALKKAALVAAVEEEVEESVE